MRLSRCCPTRSITSGETLATVRAYRRVVRVNSAPISHLGALRKSTEPGKIEKRTPRAPMYSPGTSLLVPMFERSPASSARCTASGGA